MYIQLLLLVLLTFIFNKIIFMKCNLIQSCLIFCHYMLSVKILDNKLKHITFIVICHD